MRDDGALSDEAVIARVRAGDLPVFELIMRRYNQRLFRAARAILRDDAEAEDAVQQAYLSAYAHLDQFAGMARFSTWLMRIAVREALGRRRQRQRLSEVALDGVEESMSNGSDEPTPEQLAARREMGTLVEAAVDQLPDLYRIVFMMREIENLSTSETAECLELSEEAVKVRLHRARAMLRDGLLSQVDRSLPDAFPFLGARCDRIVAAVMSELRRRDLRA
jgi:RNA polymerase sigma-70 factor, ECF subfamily